MGDYRKLNVWQKSMALAAEIYRVTEKLPARERFALSIQLRRAAVSIPSNIAEGGGRRSDAEFRRFVDIAYGSLMELETQLLLARELELIDRGTIKRLLTLVSDTGKMLNGLRSRLVAGTARRKRRTAG